MHLQIISNLLKFQEVNPINFSINKSFVEIEFEYISSPQVCPCCSSHHIIKKGTCGYRKLNHLPIFDYKTVLKLPKLRFQCKDCDYSFSVKYSFVDGKSRYTNQFKNKIADSVIGSTVTNVSRTEKIPYSTIERFFKEYIKIISPEISEVVLEKSRNTEGLVIGIDDFATRKGHSYNTGFHDLKNETFIHIVEGRKLNVLRNDVKEHPGVYTLKPIAVVMDLAQNYHTFASEVFPDAIRIADRFHVNHYALEALQDIRRRVSIEINPIDRTFIKQNKNLLSKRNELLVDEEKEKLKRILKFSKDLEDTYWWKEKLIEWYDYSINYNQAKTVYEKWLVYGHSLNINEVEIALKTFENWKDEIINYHHCRYTNAAVEGRNNKIKCIQRRGYFNRNRKIYTAKINVECNSHILTA